MRILPVSLDAVLVELSGLDETLALLEALQADPVEGVVDLVPAARTLLVQFQPWVCTQAALVAQIRSRQGRPRAREQAGELVQIPVRYDGEDLPEMAAYLKLTADELVRRHAALVWTVAFTGFTPGFAYLVIRCSMCRVAAARARAFRRGPWGWPGVSAGCIRGPRRVAGS